MSEPQFVYQYRYVADDHIVRVGSPRTWLPTAAQPAGNELGPTAHQSLSPGPTTGPGPPTHTMIQNWPKFALRTIKTARPRARATACGARAHAYQHQAGMIPGQPEASTNGDSVPTTAGRG